MPRRRNDDFLDLMILLPWWFSVVFALLIYLGVEYLFPWLFANHPYFGPFTQGLSQISYMIGLVFLLPAFPSYFLGRRKKKLLETQRSLHTIRQLSWRELEYLVAEAYRRQGYAVEENASAGADGGVDICLRKTGQTHLVQCKQWKFQKVGVKIVREMFGIMTAEQAATVKIVSCGYYTPEAMAFAQGKPIELIDGPLLLKMVSSVQRPKQDSAHSQSSDRTAGLQEGIASQNISQDSGARKCPQCHADLILRTARRGKYAGNDFYGCSTFPRCRYTETSTTH